ncbi:sugar phosphate isomerase/epimerase family protein [Paenibacillus cremeus]|uniref:Sugar phosphate isomerase/epimerase n=1 Tax=Paenibacillus cremeus TaxID=2163881 RepID=A0A559KA60_9BACL|nr:sugar phosphate isomerase/epimerase family protein [Paenibacillus cremeus]TVY09002.1 sugar phosphate isomerase/epimerase [Paenibacillus cremeus]
MIKITCFADEISKELEEQLDVLEQEGVRHLEVRGIWGKNVLDFTQDELQQIRTRLQERGFAVSSIGSPIGKYEVTDPVEPQLEALDKAIAAARALDTPYIRIFSFRTPKDEPVENYSGEVLRRMKLLTERAEQEGVTLLLENDSNLYGNTDDRCLEILAHCSSPRLRAAFDPGNYVMNNVKPMVDAYPKVSSHIEYIHIKDATVEPRQFVPAGAGSGDIPALLADLKARGFSGFLSVEPHLHHYLPEASNPERVVTAIRALQQLLKDADWAWE